MSAISSFGTQGGGCALVILSMSLNSKIRINYLKKPLNRSKRVSVGSLQTEEEKKAVVQKKMKRQEKVGPVIQCACCGAGHGALSPSGPGSVVCLGRLRGRHNV